MRETTRRVLPMWAKAMLVALGICTVWLVIQNTLLMFTVLSNHPPVTGRLAMTFVKAAALVASRFWSSPAAVALAAAAWIALLLRARPAESPHEARHG